MEKLVKKDGGGGITRVTKNWVKKNIKDQKIAILFLDRTMGNYNMRAIDMLGFEYLLSGFEWGYGGEGPHGLLWFVENYGYTKDGHSKEWAMKTIADLKEDKYKIEFKGDIDFIIPMEEVF